MQQSKLAEIIGDSAQVVHLIVSGVTKHCRRTRRNAIARALQVPEDWLSDRSKALPGALRPQSRDPSGTVIYEGDPESIPPPMQLATWEFIGACTKAFDRDMAKAWPDATERAKRYWGQGEKGGWWLLHYAMRDLINPDMWRRALYEAPKPAHPTGLTRGEREEATEALSRAFMVILKDWFVGSAELDLRSLTDILRTGRRKLKDELSPPRIAKPAQTGNAGNKRPR